MFFTSSIGSVLSDNLITSTLPNENCYGYEIKGTLKNKIQAHQTIFLLE